MRHGRTLIWAGRALAAATAGLGMLGIIVPNGPVSGSLLAAAIWLILLGGGRDFSYFFKRQRVYKLEFTSSRTALVCIRVNTNAHPLRRSSFPNHNR